MNYFQFLARQRQAAFCCAAVFILSISAQVFAQSEIDTGKKAVENQETNQSTIKTDTPEAAFNQPKFIAESFTAKNVFEPPRPETRKLRDSLNAVKTENKEQQQSPDDDTMMGVMGKSSQSSRFGGHAGFVVPIVSRGGGVTTNVGDRFVFGFPVGLTVKTKKNVAIDFEFIPTFNTGRDFVLTVHPGIIYGFKKNYAVGVRAAYDAGAGSYGLTPLVSRGFKINNKVGFFIEADFPIRSNYRAYQDRFGSIAFATHAGFAF